MAAPKMVQYVMSAVVLGLLAVFAVLVGIGIARNEPYDLTPAPQPTRELNRLTHPPEPPGYVLGGAPCAREGWVSMNDHGVKMVCRNGKWEAP